MGDQNGFFPWKVQQFISNLVQEFAPEDDIREQQRSRRTSPSDQKPSPERPNKATIESDIPELVPETKTAMIEVPKEVIDRFTPSNSEEDWEVLSEKVSNRSVGGEILVARAGSVRSIDHETSSQTTLSLPFKIQRTASSSTLDSQDNVLGPSGKGVLGVDYVEHIVLPTDTLQGVCLAYKVSASNLRRANHFSGNSLHSAPKKLLIPLSKQALRTGFIRVQDTDTKEYKLSYFQAEYPDITTTEARAYLELADWDLKDALQSAKEDREWEKEDVQNDELKSGQIGVNIKFKGGKPLLDLKGIGKSTKNVLTRMKEEITLEREDEDQKPKKAEVKQITKIYSSLPAIATKSVMAEDLFNAADQHNNFGFEMKPIPKRTPLPESG